jgi:hypothetical protein
MARLEPEFVPAAQLTESDISAIVAIGHKQAALMNELRAALQACDDLRALQLAREVVGLDQEMRKQ